MSYLRAYGNDKNRASNRIPKYQRSLEDNKNNLYSSNKVDDNKITKTIVQYQDDPEKSSALARVRKMSEQSKSRKNSPKNSDEEVENTEKNRLLFKNDKEEEEEEPVFRKKEPKESRKKVHFGEKGKEKNNNTIDNIRIKKIDDIDDEIIPKNNTQEEIKQVDNYKNRNDKNDRNDRNSKENENNNLNIVNNYRNRKYKFNNNRNYNISRNTDNNNNPEIISSKVKYNTIDNDNNYNLRNSEVVESHHNKDKIIVNEYRTKSKNKNDLKKYKTEYVWDKNINRLVEKRIYLDDNDIGDENNNEDEGEDENDINNKRPYTSRYRNKLNKYEIKDIPKNDVNEEKEKEKEKEKPKINRFNRKEEKNEEEEEDKEEFRPYKKKSKEPKLLEYTIEKIKKDKIEPEKLKGKDSRVLEVRKRFGNCQVIFKKEQKVIKKKNNNKNEPKIEKVEKDNYRTIDNTSRNKPKELNKTNDSIRYYRKGKRYTIDEDKPKPEKKEIFKETKPKYQIKKPNNTYSEVFIEKRTTFNDGKPKVEVNEIRYEPNSKLYQKRQYITNKDDFKTKIPKTFMGEKKYLKRPSYTPLDQNVNSIYTKKIIEEKKPDKKEVKEIFIEKNYEDNSNDKGNPYNYKKKNIRIQMVSEKFEDDGNNVKNTTYQKYTNNSKNTKPGKLFISSRFDNNFNDFRKKEFIPSYDDINEVMDDEEFRNFAGFNKYEIRPGDNEQERPYYKKKIQVEEVRGTNDVLKKFSKSQDRYEKEFDY